MSTIPIPIQKLIVQQTKEKIHQKSVDVLTTFCPTLTEEDVEVSMTWIETGLDIKIDNHKEQSMRQSLGDKKYQKIEQLVEHYARDTFDKEVIALGGGMICTPFNP